MDAQRSPASAGAGSAISAAHARMLKEAVIMATPRWEPFREMQTLRDAMERFVQEGIMRPASSFIPGMRGGAVPVDVIEHDDVYLVRVALPGVRPEQATVTLQGHMLTIRGELSASEAGKGLRWLMHEIRTGPFYRTLSLPSEVDADQSTARFRQGILELTLPKRMSVRPHQIQIQPTGSEAGRQGQPARGEAGEAPRNGHATADTVSEASQESFPASDAPAWSGRSTSGTSDD